MEHKVENYEQQHQSKKVLAGSRVDGSLRPSVLFVAMGACDDELMCDRDIQRYRQRRYPIASDFLTASRWQLLGQATIRVRPEKCHASMPFEAG